MNALANQGNDRLAAEQSRVTERLLQQFECDHWEGHLSSSALSTAVATIALGEIDRANNSPQRHCLIHAGLKWLAENQNADGGWGDTERSKSNISTTALCWAAFGAAAADRAHATTVRRAEEWLRKQAGTLEKLPEAIAQRYGKDRTFSVPILMTLAISGRFPPESWRKIPALPFELAVFPRQFFGALNLPVVSYALPALIAIGNAIHTHAPSRSAIARSIRNWAQPRVFKLLSEIQPENGGFLEATPLTAFVTMSLAVSGLSRHPVASKAVQFLTGSVRADGSWPIDTNLATWVTTLSVKALSHQPNALTSSQCASIRAWLLNQQTKIIHSYTGAAAGAWAWTDLPGGVPDADDTAGALLALSHLGPPDATTLSAVDAGVRWLLGVQNSDGGIPTFCRGWGTLPFDRSTPELTAHALRAWNAWREHLPRETSRRVPAASERAFRYLRRVQRSDGSFVPLWFGNEYAAEEENPVYGTAQVLIALNEINEPHTIEQRSRAAQFLASSQQPEGGWGGDRNAVESIEETALALEALAGTENNGNTIHLGKSRLLHLLDAQPHAAAIGLYFARLWYYEKLYPLIFATSALGKLASQRR